MSSRKRKGAAAQAGPAPARGRAAALAAAAAAAAAAPRVQPRRPGAGAPPPPPPPPPAGESAASKKALKLAQEQSRRDAYSRFSNTAMLWAWGRSYVGWTLPPTASREQILTALARGYPTLPTGVKQLLSNWRTVTSSNKSAMPPKDGAARARARGAAADHSASDDDDDDRSVDESDNGSNSGGDFSDSDSGSDDEQPAAQPAAKKQRRAAGPTTAAVPTSASATSAAASGAKQCPHCRAVLQSSFKYFKCTDCGRTNEYPRDHPENVELKRLYCLNLAAAANGGAAGASSSSSSGSGSSSSLAFGQSHTGTAAPAKLSKRELELKRLAADGPVFPWFDDRTPVADKEATQLASESFRASLFAAPSAGLLELVQSGKLTQMGAATPLAIGAAAALDRAGGAGVSTFQMGPGGITSVDHTVFPLVTSFEGFVEAFAATIVPALISQPRALLGWTSLLRSVIAITHDQDWETARSYVDQALARNVEQRTPFGKFDRSLLEDARSIKHETPRKQQRQQQQEGRPARNDSHSRSAAGSAAGGNGERPTRSKEGHASGVCRDYNFNRDGCSRGSGCPHKHECIWVSCTTKGKHVGTDCPQRPASDKAFTAAGSHRRGSGGGGSHQQ